jgi:hypothetical protein
MNIDLALERARTVTVELADPDASLHLGDEAGNVLWALAHLLPAERRAEVLELLPLLRDLCLARMHESTDEDVVVEILGRSFHRPASDDPIEASTWLAGVGAALLLDDTEAVAAFLAYDGEVGEVLGAWQPALALAVRARLLELASAPDAVAQAQATARSLGLGGDRDDVRMAERALSVLALAAAADPTMAWRVAPRMVDPDDTEVGLAFLGLSRRWVQAGAVLPERDQIGRWLVDRRGS